MDIPTIRPHGSLRTRLSVLTDHSGVPIPALAATAYRRTGRAFQAYVILAWNWRQARILRLVALSGTDSMSL